MLPDESAPRSRRAILSAAAGGLAGLVAGALGRPSPTNAAAGDVMRLGQTNDSGTSQTILLNAGLGAAFTLKTTNASSGATGIFGWSSSTGMGATRGVYGRADGPNSYGVFGRQNGLAGDGAAVSAEGNLNDGLVATTSGASSKAIRAVTTSAAGGAGAIYGEASATSPTADAVAVYGLNRGTGATGVAVLGTHVGGGVGVYGSTAGGGAGAYGFAPSGIGTIGGSNSGTGVSGSSNTGVGVSGQSNSGTGVLGLAPDGTAVYGSSTTGIGVYGSSVDTFAGFFENNVHVVGTLSKGAGSFKIDHPLDPARKYLNHSFVESPDMLNVYSGTATLDAKGSASIQLPGYFDALNRDVRYQLTPIGGPAPDLHVKATVAKGRFRIAGGAAGQEICWQVTGIRKDAYAEAHRIVAEEAKSKADQGLYLHPELFGQPPEKSLASRYRPPDVMPPVPPAARVDH